MDKVTRCFECGKIHEFDTDFCYNCESGEWLEDLPRIKEQEVLYTHNKKTHISLEREPGNYGILVYKDGEFSFNVGGTATLDNVIDAYFPLLRSWKRLFKPRIKPEIKPYKGENVWIKEAAKFAENYMIKTY